MICKKTLPDKTGNGQISVPDRIRALDKKQYFCVLATNDNGQSYTSLISFAVTPDLKRIIFATPKKTSKYKNILKTRNVAILIDNRSSIRKNLMETEAVTIIGTARPVRKGKNRDEFASLFLKKHPDLEEFIQSDDTALIVVEAARGIHVGKFQTVTIWDCK
jgi:heme iron utilization protein